jgi:ribosomal protein S8E
MIEWIFIAYCYQSAVTIEMRDLSACKAALYHVNSEADNNTLFDTNTIIKGSCINTQTGQIIENKEGGGS